MTPTFFISIPNFFHDLQTLIVQLCINYIQLNFRRTLNSLYIWNGIDYFHLKPTLPYVFRTLVTGPSSFPVFQEKESGVILSTNLSLLLNAFNQLQLFVDFPSKYFSNLPSPSHLHYCIINSQFNHLCYTVKAS